MATDSTALHSSFDSLEARMAAFKAKAAPQAASTEESKQQQQAADPIEDPYDAFITPISAHNIVPAHSPMRQYSPSLEAQAAALLDVPALPLDMSSPSRPDHSTASDPETPPPELPPSGKRGSVTLSNISTSSSADSPHAVDHVELSSSPPVGLVLQYASDGETGPSSSRRSAAPRVPPRSHTKGKSTDDAQSWAEAEQIQKARAIEKELAATRRRQQQQQQEQDRRAREAYQTPPRAAPPASASSAGAGVSPLSARSRGAGGLGSESARGHSTGDGASAAAVLNALKRKQELARRGAAGAGSGSQTSRSGPSSNPYAASSSSSSSGPARAADAPLTARGFLTARGGRAQGAYDSYAGAAADYEEDDDDGIAGSTTARGGSASLPQQQRRADAASNARGSAPASASAASSSSSSSLSDQRKREIAERKEKLRIRKANALNAITIASTPVEEGGTLQTARGPPAAKPQAANGATKGGPEETRRPNEGRNCSSDPACVVM